MRHLVHINEGGLQGKADILDLCRLMRNMDQNTQELRVRLLQLLQATAKLDAATAAEEREKALAGGGNGGDLAAVKPPIANTLALFAPSVNLFSRLRLFIVYRGLTCLADWMAEIGSLAISENESDLELTIEVYLLVIRVGGTHGNSSQIIVHIRYSV